MNIENILNTHFHLLNPIQREKRKKDLENIEDSLSYIDSYRFKFKSFRGGGPIGTYIVKYISDEEKWSTITPKNIEDAENRLRSFGFENSTTHYPKRGKVYIDIKITTLL